MKGDFSRQTFDPKKRYNRVLMQQGRVQLDADWNEQVDVINHRLETETHDLIGSGGAPIESPGFEIKVSSWLKFDGDDDYIYVEGQSDFSFKGKHPFTLEAWVSPHRSDSVSTIISKFNAHGSAGSLKGEYFLDIQADGCVSFHRVEIIEDEFIEEAIIEDGEVEDAAVIRIEKLALSSLHTEKKLSFHHFSHVAVTFDGEESRIYINGRVAAQQKHERRGVHTNVPVLIGARMFDDEPALFYSGRMNDLRVWNVAQSKEQIRHNMNRRLGGHEHGLVAYWRADEIADHVVRDLTGHRHDGVFGGGEESQRPSPDSGGVLIGSGRYYVDGVLCENEDEMLYTRQPDYPGAVLPESGSYLAYLDAWPRFITAVEDPAIREVALGGPDTAARSKIIAQVKLLPIREEQDEAPHRAWHSFTHDLAGKAKLRARHQATASLLGNQLYRVEVHSGGGVYGGSRSKGTPVMLQSTEPDEASEIQVQVADLVVDGISLQTGQWVEVFSGLEGETESPGSLMPINNVSPATLTITLGLQGVSPGFLNQDCLRLRPIATLKWSRENGSVVFPISSITQNEITLSSLGQDEYQLGENNWVEASNDTYVLQGSSAPLLKVNQIKRTPPIVTVLESPPADIVDPAAHPQLRRWDQQTINGDPLVGGIIPAQAAYDQSSWLNLENGIQVSFDDGILQTGDYWLIPARTNTGTIEWPGDDSGDPAALPPHGILHHYSLLALLRFNDGSVMAHDYRRVFAPLTDKQSSETISGSLTIDGSLHVDGEAHLNTLHGEQGHFRDLHARETHVERLHAGETFVAELHGALAADMVGEKQIVDGSVTRAKLAEDVGNLWSFPSGYSLLGQTHLPPHDFTYTGSSLVVPHQNAGWTTRATAHVKGLNSLASAVVRDHIYTFTNSGAVWEFNPATDVWRERALMPDCGQPGGVAAVNGRIYVFFNSGDVWEYDPAVESPESAWTEKSKMPKRRHTFGVAVVQEKIYVIGGKRKVLGLLSITTKRNEAYDPANDSWEKRRSMYVSRQAFGIGVVNDKICLVGGREGVFFGIFGRAAETDEKYNPARNMWSAGLPATPVRRTHIGIGVVDNQVHAIGGKHHDHWTATNETLEPWTGWSEAKPLRRIVSSPNVLVIKGKVYVIGGDPSHPHTCIVEEWPVSSIYYIHQKKHTAEHRHKHTDPS